MKKISLFRLITIPAVLGLIFSLSFCKKDTETTTITVHDTITNTVHDTIRINDTLYIQVHDTSRGKNISGLATYPDYSGTIVPAKGAVVILYFGSTANPSNVVAYTYANASGTYSFPFMLPGPYFIYSKYNTTNKNFRVIEGINFETNPGYAITMGSSDYTQNLSLVTIAASMTTKITTDSALAASDTTFKKVTFNTHSKVTWESLYNQGNSQTIAGAFNTFQFKTFVFDEANPANTIIDGYVLLSSLTTFEPARDALGTGCVSKTMRVDTLNATTPLTMTDTARLYTTSVQKYGDGYLARGMMKAFYMTGPSSPQTYAVDTAGVPSMYWNTTIEKPVDVYFTFERKKVWNAAHTTFNWEFIFEAMFTFKAKTDYYVNSNNIGDAVTVKPHILVRGANNVEY